MRTYAADYAYTEGADGLLHITRRGSRSSVTVPPVIDLDESLVSFFGFYSGDGAKGSESQENRGTVRPTISVSQSEPHLIRFSVEQFRKIFPGSIYFTFSLGEDSAYFMAGEGLEQLRAYYGGTLPALAPLSDVRPRLDAKDEQFLKEKRDVAGTSEEHLAFYYQHKEAMRAILRQQKEREIARVFALGPGDRADASLRRPFKKGAREPGGSSRADETHVGGVAGFGELFLKMLHEIEGSVFDDVQTSMQGLIVWSGKPSKVGELVDVMDFFTSHPYGAIGNARPTITAERGLFASEGTTTLIGCWPRSKETRLKSSIRINPLWCYAAGLYLAEGTTGKSDMLAMYTQAPSGFGLGFTSSENTSLELILRALQMLFQPEDCLDAWKVKVGSQYFPELVVIGLKNGVPMLRGGASGDGKLRTMEISLAIRDWALAVAPCLEPYAGKYSHVEPTGAGVARIDFWASSKLCKWFFALILYAAFGGTIADPRTGFC
ncbi:MAG TPA: hypothetical protein VNK46_12395 [Nitrospiraceae bacterium]|nr:hypothetical protein [Nitrospiraceae bacterium]